MVSQSVMLKHRSRRVKSWWAKPARVSGGWRVTLPHTALATGPKESPRGSQLQNPAPQGKPNPSHPGPLHGDTGRCSEAAQQGEGQGGRAEPLLCLHDNPRLTPFTHTAQHP